MSMKQGITTIIQETQCDVDAVPSLFTSSDDVVVADTGIDNNVSEAEVSSSSVKLEISYYSSTGPE